MRRHVLAVLLLSGLFATLVAAPAPLARPARRAEVPEVVAVHWRWSYAQYSGLCWNVCFYGDGRYCSELADGACPYEGFWEATGVGPCHQITLRERYKGTGNAYATYVFVREGPGVYRERGGTKLTWGR